jgi:hypothetical protein
MNLNDALSINNAYSTIKNLRDQDVIVDDVKCLYQFCNQKTFVQSVQSNGDFKSASASDKWVK